MTTVHVTPPGMVRAEPSAAPLRSPDGLEKHTQQIMGWEYRVVLFTGSGFGLTWVRRGDRIDLNLPIACIVFPLVASSSRFVFQYMPGTFIYSGETHACVDKIRI